MRPIDFVKAFVTAIIVMVLNVAISFGVVAVYAYLIEPGHDAAFYEAAAQDIAPWSSVVFGVILFFVAAYIFGKRRPGRDAMHFALAIFASYALVEFLILGSEGVIAEMIGIVSLSLATKLGAAILGVRMAAR
ncbi:MAG: hypothetical protein HKN14_16585 [Marinicaulis sp.]|nr:hypothetical protein [Marinicaulis sp.]NNE42525.1 hypothetical protein [Marinicaulis sp.]NNL88960.1 hypothetical protein [Marinicaulis sp.]